VSDHHHQEHAGKTTRSECTPEHGGQVGAVRLAPLVMHQQA
jgi:hypothetical protein